METMSRLEAIFSRHNNATMRHVAYAVAVQRRAREIQVFAACTHVMAAILWFHVALGQAAWEEQNSEESISEIEELTPPPKGSETSQACVRAQTRSSPIEQSCS